MMKTKITALCLMMLTFLLVQAQESTPMVRYAFNAKTNSDSILDESGNGYNAKLYGGAFLKKLGNLNVLQTGQANGYLNFGSKLGNLIASLSDFTISTYLYIDPSLVLSNNGNFVWSFSNAADINTSAAGCMFYSAKSSRYVICQTNWNNEKSVSVGTASVIGKWTHITYTQSGTTGTVYIDGSARKSGTISLLPTTLGATPYNYLGKSAYASDQYLMNSMYSDFRIYNKALNATEVSKLDALTAKLDTLTYKDLADYAAENLSLGDITAIVSNLDLPTIASNGATIQWSTSNAAVVSAAGVIIRPSSGADTATATLTATITMGFVSVSKAFTIKVAPNLSDQARVQSDADSLVLRGNIKNLRSNLLLPTTGAQGCSITWISSQPTMVSSSGVIIHRPVHGSGNATIHFTATIALGSSSLQKTFTVSLAEDEGFAAYLFAFFTGNNISQEAIRFATSTDGFTFTALNNNNPVLSSASISSTGGVRDPHILRGEADHSYYMVVTDMVSANGWNSNRALVLLKSSNLTDWTSTVINIPNTYAVYSAADRIWAPQTIYDPLVGKYMVYFAMRLGSGDPDKIYYAYVNSSFTAFESAPMLLFNNNGLSTIDADIVCKDSVYQLFFKTEGNGNGIKKAVSTSLTSGYVLVDKYLQSTTNAVEGGCVFRMFNTDNWILMYDMYTSGAYQFTQSTDLLNFSVVSNPISFDFTPRHGTIIPITAAELNALNVKWNPSAVALNRPSRTFSVYTNSAQDRLYVQFDGAAEGSFRVEIHTLAGLNVLKQTLNNDGNQIDLRNLKAGVYLLTCIKDNETMETMRFIVK
jgi:hypothetical protein